MKLREIEEKIASKLRTFLQLKEGVKKVYRMSESMFRKKGKYFLKEGVKIKEIGEFRSSKLETFVGYYDIIPWNEEGRYYLLHIYERGKNYVNIGIYDVYANQLKVIDKSLAYNFQQGTRLNWIGKEEVIYNTVVDKHLVSKIVNVKKNKTISLLPIPIQVVDSVAKYGLTLNYKRLHKIRPEYGYEVEVKNFSHKMSYKEDGIWEINIPQGSFSLIITLSQLKRNMSTESMQNAEHKVNHIMYRPDGKGFIFMHRWKKRGRRYSRLYYAEKGGKGLRFLMGDELVSHYCWIDNETIIVWGKGGVGENYYLINIHSPQNLIPIKELSSLPDGHPSYKDNWIITDTYPDRGRFRELILFNFKTKEVVELGKFYSSLRYEDYYRCDLHPRWHPSEYEISIDSTHSGIRRSYILSFSPGGK